MTYIKFNKSLLIPAVLVFIALNVVILLVFNNSIVEKIFFNNYFEVLDVK